jgi:hypothetical protein
MTTFKTIDVRRPDQFPALLVALNRSHATYGSALFRTLQASERCFSHVWRMTDRFAPEAAHQKFRGKAGLLGRYKQFALAMERRGGRDGGGRFAAYEGRSDFPQDR